MTYGSWLWGMMVVCVCTLAMTASEILQLDAILSFWRYFSLISPMPPTDKLRNVLRVGNKNTTRVQIKSNILNFVPTTRLGKEGLQNVHLQTGLWSESTTSLA